MSKYNHTVLPFFIALMLFSACAYADHPCQTYDQPSNTGNLSRNILSETSGIAFGKVNPDVMWAHNDSGAEPLIYAVTKTGEMKGQWKIEGVKAVDWEDIAVGPCEINGKESCIFIADMGNNKHKRQDMSIIVVKEPNLATDQAWTDEPGKLETNQVISLQYEPVENAQPEESNPDTESLMIHPKTGELYTISKSIKGEKSILFHIPRPKANETVKPEPLGSWLFSAFPVFGSTTGADFSPSGTHYVIRTYWKAYEYDIEAYGSVEAAFQHPRFIFHIGEKQGESIAYDPDGITIWTVGEGELANVLRYSCAEKGNVSAH